MPNIDMLITLKALIKCWHWHGLFELEFFRGILFSQLHETFVNSVIHYIIIITATLADKVKTWKTCICYNNHTN